MTERTFIAIKPDGVKRNLIGRIITRFEEKGYKIIGLKLLQPTMELAEKHYEEHKGKPFYPRLIRLPSRTKRQTGIKPSLQSYSSYTIFIAQFKCMKIKIQFKAQEIIQPL